MADYATLIRPTIGTLPRRANHFALSEVGLAYVKPPPQKHFASVFRKIMIDCRRPAFTRGAFRDRHERGRRDAMDAVRATTRRGSRTAKSCGPDPPTLGSSPRVTNTR